MSIWHDVYHLPFKDMVLYVKFTKDEDGFYLLIARAVVANSGKVRGACTAEAHGQTRLKSWRYEVPVQTGHIVSDPECLKG